MSNLFDRVANIVSEWSGSAWAFAIALGTIAVWLVTGPLPLAHAIAGAIAAGIVVVGAAIVVRRPLTAVPENWLKFFVGAMLSSFGVFWFAEGTGAHWAGDAASLPVILALFLAASWVAVRALRR